MKTYTYKDAPLRVFGVPFFEKTGVFRRLPEAICQEVERLRPYGERTPGARIGFRTDAERFTVRIRLKKITPDVGMSIFAAQSCSVMVGDRQNAVFRGTVSPSADYRHTEAEKEFKKSPQMEEITLWLPRNEAIDNVEVLLPDEAKVEPPTPYRYGPAVYYGSSITEGGCAGTVTNNYTALLSRWLDLDFYCMGFSGSARGDLAVAEYMNGLDMRLFVYDYDHNAPTVDFLRETHEPFFKRIREAHPTLPVLFLSRPNFDESSDGAARRAVILETYERAKASGDENVYFVDGASFFGDEDRTLCTVDTVHPNDLGFYRMAKAILPTMRQILEKSEK